MDLRVFIDKAKELGELEVIEGAHWNLEMGTITHKRAKEENPPALLFDKIPDYKPGYRVLTLSLSSYKRLNLSQGLPIESEGLEMLKNLKDKLSGPLHLIPPKEVEKGPVMQNIYYGEDVDLFSLPSPKWHALDGGQYIGTGDLVIVRDPDEGWINVGTHRIQIQDKSTATINIEPGKHCDMIRKKYWEKGENCPVAVTLGSDPFYILVGGTRIPWGISEYDYMGWWKNEPVEVIKGPTTGLPIPADAEIALEGEIVPPEVDCKTEGPFSEWTGHYTTPIQEPAFRVKCILHRNDPINLGMLPFLGPGVFTYGSQLLKAAHLWSHLDNVVPGVLGVWPLEEFGGPHAFAISIKQMYNGHAKQTAIAALGEHNYNRKFIIVVDDDIDVTNLKDVMFAVGMRSNPEKWDIVRECWCGILDPTITRQQRETGDITHSAVMILACKPYYRLNEFPPRVV